jgi:hypothetical protein
MGRPNPDLLKADGQDGGLARNEGEVRSTGQFTESISGIQLMRCTKRYERHSDRVREAVVGLVIILSGTG